MAIATIVVATARVLLVVSLPELPGIRPGSGDASSASFADPGNCAVDNGTTFAFAGVTRTLPNPCHRGFE